ncbi:TolC family protein [Aquabacter cavernae]|uniref:TolC family protein n=1 Tax=Aquabacter cavernae TaxID=2496029 RepID=UPI000F8DA266|nr:TolC family protein [Aquabacter cavernae]
MSRRALSLPLMALLLGAALAGCATQALQTAPQDAAAPWTPNDPPGGVGMLSGERPPQDGTSPQATKVFAVPAEPQVAELQPVPATVPGKAYGLADLIDVAQTQNPATRIAWQQARQAALATGMVEASFLPFISANVIGGYQKLSTPLPVPLPGVNSLSNEVSGVSPQIALQWLVFDFGQRAALHETARQNANASNILFNGVHQKIIYDVTRAYFLYGAARSRVTIAEQNLANSRRIEEAAQSRMANGLGTTVEVAQARQQVAQARFGLVQSQGGERDAYQALLGAMGVSPLAQIRVREANGRALPESVGAPTERMIKAALVQRPDVLASFSALKASEAGITAAQAEFAPKVFLGAVAATGNTSLSATGLPTIGQQSSASGFMMGATMPLYDGGLRAARLKGAESLADASQATFQKVRDAAAREIVVAADTLRSALASYRAATELASAAAVTYDAAFDAYKNGLGTITAATVADSGLITARQAKTDAHAASLVAAANLAFVLGAMTSADMAGGLLAR